MGKINEIHIKTQEELEGKAICCDNEAFFSEDVFELVVEKNIEIQALKNIFKKNVCDKIGCDSCDYNKNDECEIKLKS